MKTMLETAPRAAFRFAATAELVDKEVDLAAAKDGVLTVPFQLLARTANAVDHWYWGPIVHDFAGMSHRDKLPVDMQHSYSDPVGFADGFAVTSEGLLISGGLVALVNHEDDEALKLILRGRAGVPYQGSIDFDPWSVVMELVPEGMTAECNGMTVTGPITIARQWTLLGVAVCLHGIDGGTEARFSRGDATAEAPIPIQWKGKDLGTMSKEKPSESDSEPTKEQLGQFSAELKAQRDKYVGRFGSEFGTGYLAEGLTYTEALETHVGKLSKDLEAANERAVAAEEKLRAAQLSHGEPGPIDTGAPKTPGTPAAKGGLMSMVKRRG